MELPIGICVFDSNQENHQSLCIINTKGVSLGSWFSLKVSLEVMLLLGCITLKPNGPTSWNPVSDAGSTKLIKSQPQRLWGRNIRDELGQYHGCSWWRHQMETFSALLAICAGNSPVSGEFPAQRPVTRSFDVFFDLRMNERLSKHSWGWWLDTPSCPLRRQSNVIP